MTRFSTNQLSTLKFNRARKEDPARTTPHALAYYLATFSNVIEINSLCILMYLLTNFVTPNVFS